MLLSLSSKKALCTIIAAVAVIINQSVSPVVDTEPLIRGTCVLDDGSGGHEDLERNRQQLLVGAAAQHSRDASREHQRVEGLNAVRSHGKELCQGLGERPGLRARPCMHERAW